MWGKTEEGQPALVRTPSSTGTQAAATIMPVVSERATVLGKSIRLVGDVVSDEELYVDGELEGTLELRGRLTVGPNGKVQASIRAHEIIVFGSVRGNVETEQRISLRAGATFVGDIKTAGIVIEDGAYFKGGIDISRSEPAKASGKSSTSAGKHPEVTTAAGR